MVALDIILNLVNLNRHESPFAIIVMASFLPCIALVLFLIEVVIANRAPIWAVLIYRFQVPACFFVLVILLYTLDRLCTKLFILIYQIVRIYR